MEPVFPLDLTLPARGKGHIARELHQQLRSAIVEGRLAAGFVLPSTRQVADAFGIGRNTAVTAYDLLVAEGYVQPRTGAKAVVAEIAARRQTRARAARPVDHASWLHPMWSASVPSPGSRPGLPPRSFRLGVPEHRYFPHALWRRLTAQSLRRLARKGFGYAPTEGLPELCEGIAHHIAFARAVACSAADVVVTTSAQQAFSLIALALITPQRRVVAVEDPGYGPLRSILAGAGAELVPVPVDDEGMRIDAIPANARMVCVTPSHQSPTGVALSMKRRTALLEFARTHDAVVVEDDYDGEFRYGARPLDALQTLDRDARVFYVGTFTKSLFPELRKGFVVAPAWARPALVAVKSKTDSNCDALNQAVLAAFIRDGHLARYLRRMRKVYAERHAVLVEGLHQQLHPWLEPIAAEAGLHVAARIRRKRDVNAIFEAAHVHTPGVVSMSSYASAPGSPPGIVFGFGLMDAGEIGPALLKLRRALEGEKGDRSIFDGRQK
jgi:GntR family transcriptional regulator/MocR family aminotransferase